MPGALARRHQHCGRSVLQSPDENVELARAVSHGLLLCHGICPSHSRRSKALALLLPKKPKAPGDIRAHPLSKCLHVPAEHSFSCPRPCLHLLCPLGCSIFTASLPCSLPFLLLPYLTPLPGLSRGRQDRAVQSRAEVFLQGNIEVEAAKQPEKQVWGCHWVMGSPQHLPITCSLHLPGIPACAWAGQSSPAPGCMGHLLPLSLLQWHDGL